MSEVEDAVTVRKRKAAKLAASGPAVEAVHKALTEHGVNKIKSEFSPKKRPQSRAAPAQSNEDERNSSAPRKRQKTKRLRRDEGVDHVAQSLEMPRGEHDEREDGKPTETAGGRRRGVHQDDSTDSLPWSDHDSGLPGRFYLHKQQSEPLPPTRPYESTTPRPEPEADGDRMDICFRILKSMDITQRLVRIAAEEVTLDYTQRALPEVSGRVTGQVPQILAEMARRRADADRIEGATTVLRDAESGQVAGWLSGLFADQALLHRACAMVLGSVDRPADAPVARVPPTPPGSSPESIPRDFSHHREHSSRTGPSSSRTKPTAREYSSSLGGQHRRGCPST